MKTLCMVTLSMCVGLLSACAEDADAPDETEAGETNAEPLAAVGLPRPSAAQFGCPGERIALRSSNGSYVSALNNLLGGMMVDRQTPSDAETFTVYPVGQNQVALQANHGYFIAAVGSSLFAIRRTIDSETTFTLHRHFQPGAWALQTSGGAFVTAERGGGSVLNASRTSVGEWQAFTVLCRIDTLPTNPGLPPGSTIGGTTGVGGTGPVPGTGIPGGTTGVGGNGVFPGTPGGTTGVGSNGVFPGTPGGTTGVGSTGPLPGSVPGTSGNGTFPGTFGGTPGVGGNSTAPGSSNIPGQSGGWQTPGQTGAALPGQSGGWQTPGQTGAALPGQSGGWQTPGQTGGAFPANGW